MNRLLTTLCIVFSLQAFGLSGIEMVKKADEMRYIDSDNSFIVEVNDFKTSGTQKTKFKVFSKGAHTSLVETVFPERQFDSLILHTF